MQITCRICNRRYEYNENQGYDRGGLCGPMCHGIEIGRGAMERRVRANIDDAVHTIIRCWEEWEAGANQQAQQEQDPDAYFCEMQNQVGAVLEGVVDSAVEAGNAPTANKR